MIACRDGSVSDSGHDQDAPSGNGVWRTSQDMYEPKTFPTAVTNATRIKDFKRAGMELVDEAGRHADLHALRSTLATKLAQAGTPPQVAQRLMHHSDYRTTMTHYTRLRLADTSAAIERLGPVQQQPKASPHHSQHDSVQSEAS